MIDRYITRQATTSCRWIVCAVVGAVIIAIGNGLAYFLHWACIGASGAGCW